MRVAINGFGRIGRTFFKIALQKGINIVAINDLTEPKTLAYLLKYDSAYGRYNKKVKVKKGFLYVGSKKIRLFSHYNPEDLPWDKLNIDVVIESTGLFTNKVGASKHLNAGAKRVLISAPSSDADITVVMGVNEKEITKDHKIISNASCTTNSIAPLLKIIDEGFGVTKGFMTTVHAYTGNQNLVDGPHKKLRRARAAANNIIPTSTGAANAVTQVLPKLRGKIDARAIRVPVLTGSITEFNLILKKSVTVKQVNELIKKKAKKHKGVIEYCEDEIVSSDIIGNPNSTVFDSLLTKANANMIQIFSWYDNEYGYSSRLVDILKYLK